MEDLKSFRLKDIMQIENAEIIDKLLNKCEVMALVGNANSCKTTVALNLALNLVNNSYWLDRFKTSGKKVLFVNTSSELNYILDTIEKFGRNEVVNENLEILDLRNIVFNKIEVLQIMISL